MTRSILWGVLAVAALAACDPTPMKPEVGLPGATATPAAQPASGERSLRLQGPGVSRYRQILV